MSTYDYMLWGILFVCSFLVIYHYILYPAAVVVFARIVRRRAPSARPPVSVSLIVSAYNEEAVIAEKARNSLALAYPQLQVLFVCDGSDDGTVSRLQPFGGRGITVLHRPERAGKAAAMNRAAALATGDVLVFSDANAMYRADAIDALVAGFADEAVGIVSGAKAVRPRGTRTPDDAGFGRSEGLYWRYENRIRAAESLLGSTVATVGEIFAVRRSVFRPLPPGTVNDDAWLTIDALRRGYSVRFAEDACCEELASVNVVDEKIRRRRISAGRWRMLSDLGNWPLRRPWVMAALVSHKALRLLMPFLLVMILLADAALVALDPAAPLPLALLIAQLLGYSAALAGRAAEQRRGLLWRAARLAYFVVESNVSVLLGFLDWMRGGNLSNWKKAER